ncbi:MAG: uroporphyrinogen-III C-methyltransferase [Clostridia bacterium]|nr:uroporphyrinogen-III C-methyltransferase [Clostridia bacterium]
MNKGKVYLVGAGPGDRGLLTLKGAECLKKADVIIYDKLVCPSLLNINGRCELIFAGKEAGNHHLSQDKINKLLVEKAMEGNIVVRLKGGDPFIFGRGGEEAQELVKHNIEFEVVPGVSSCYAAGAYAGIPITHRDYASSFHVITGHELKSNINYAVLAKESGTLVFMMSLNALSSIVQKLMENGKDKNTPVAVIEHGTTAMQRYVAGTLETISDIVAKNKMKTPALLIVGKVVKFHEELSWFGKKPLFGKNILVTSTAKMAEELGRIIEDLGGYAAEISLIKTVPINCDKVKQLNFDSYTWIWFSSANGVEIFFDFLKRELMDIRKLSHIKFAVVGERTAEKLKSYGIFADCIPEKFESKYLAQKLQNRLTPNDHVLMLRAEAASDIVCDIFSSKGINYTDIAIYKTETDYSKEAVLNIYGPNADYVVLASASAVKAFKELTYNDLSKTAKVICIGEVTAKAAKELDIHVHKTAKKSTAHGIVECILEDLKRRE